MADQTFSLPPVFFNHLYVVLDDKTYRAIQGSDFLQSAFPGKEKRSTLTAAGETWSGTYFYGQDNYLEFFGSGNNPLTGLAARGGHWQAGAQVGWAGIAFSTDRRGGAAAVRQALRAAFNYEPFSELRQMRAGDKTINWFYQVRLAEQLGLGSFDSWLMEYHPDVFAHKNIPLPPSGEVTRLAYLSPWNSQRISEKGNDMRKDSASPPQDDSRVQPASPEILHSRKGMAAAGIGATYSSAGSPRPPVFSRVIGATLHIDSRRARRFAEILALLDYAQEERDGGFALSAHGFTLRILPEESGPRGFRLSSLRMAMSRISVAPMTFVFAPGSKLSLHEDLTADWEFGL